MANHKSSLKRIRQTEQRRIHNRYFAVTARNLVKQLRETSNKVEAEKLLPLVSSRLDKLAKQQIIHRNKAANLISSLTKHVHSLQ